MDAADNLGVAVDIGCNNFRARLLQLYLPVEFFIGAVTCAEEKNFTGANVAARRVGDCACVVGNFIRADFQHGVADFRAHAHDDFRRRH